VIPYLHEYDLLFTDAREPKTLLEPFSKAQLEDYPALLELCKGVDTVLHLGAIGYDHTNWQELVAPNIVGVQNILLAAKAAKCRRVILMSSVQAMWGHTHQPILETDTPYPTNFYGATKVFAEALGRVHSHDSSLSVICIRLGAVFRPRDLRLHSSHPEIRFSITERDLAQLLQLCLQSSEHFAVFNGVSDHTNTKFSLEKSREILGYAPQDDIMVLAAKNRFGVWRHRLSQVKRYIQKLFLS
jgi:uronate dehydrogenase